MASYLTLLVLLLQENLFYNVPYGAMQAYRESIESLWLRYKVKEIPFVVYYMILLANLIS